jgi:hypothetical protein
MKCGIKRVLYKTLSRKCEFREHQFSVVILSGFAILYILRPIPMQAETAILSYVCACIVKLYEISNVNNYVTPYAICSLVHDKTFRHVPWWEV